jgi:hypothetical protein
MKIMAGSYFFAWFLGATVQPPIALSGSVKDTAFLAFTLFDRNVKNWQKSQSRAISRV